MAIITFKGLIMNKKQQILEHIKLAAMAGDDKKAMCLYVENRISRADYDKAFNLGVSLRGLL